MRSSPPYQEELKTDEVHVKIYEKEVLNNTNAKHAERAKKQIISY